MSDAPTTQDSAFWRFSLRFYAAPGVAQACLQLQDECGMDVNVMLYLLFLARTGRLLEDDDVARIDMLSAGWRDNVVRPLRRARRFMKTPPDAFGDPATAALRTEVKRIELEAERLQQLCLERSLPPQRLGSAHADLRRCASHNLAAYMRRLGDFPSAPVETLLRRLHDM